MNKSEKNEEIERLMSIVNSMKSHEGLNQEQKEKRIKYFDVWNNSTIMGITGSPYDSKEYREMTDAIFLQE